MRFSVLKTGLLLLMSAAIFTGCGRKAAVSDIVSVSILPQKYIVDELTGGALDVNVMIPPGASHGTYAPTSQQFQKLSDSKLYISIGHLGYEQAWIHRLKELNPNMVELNWSEKTALIRGEVSCHGDHAHEGGVDPHIWMSPTVMLQLLPVTKSTLISSFPNLKDTIEANYSQLFVKLETTHQRLMEVSESLTNRSFLIFHPVLTYLARDYGFEQIPIEYDGKEPSPALLIKTIEYAKDKGIRVIFIQQEYDKRNAQLISEETNTKMVQINPLAYNWLESMNDIINKLQDNLK